MKNKSGFGYRTILVALLCLAVAFVIWLFAKASV